MSIFRENALKAVGQKGVGDSSLRILTPSIYLGVGASFLILLAILLWGTLTNIPMAASGEGIMVSSSDWQSALYNNDQTLFEKREALNEAKRLLTKKRELYEKHYLTENDMVQAERDYLEAKNAYATPTPTDYIGLGSMLFTNKATKANQALVLISNDNAKRIQAGMTARIYHRDAKYLSGGGYQATLVSVTQYPISKELAESYLGNRNMVDQLFAQGVPYFAVVKTKDLLSSGMLITARIITHTCHPIQLLIQSDC